MQTIDIAQAIKENSTSVSQNLDSSVLGGLIGVVTESKHGLMPKQMYFKSVNLSDVIYVLEYDDAYSLSKFLMACYTVGRNGLAIVNPNLHNSLDDFKIVKIGSMNHRFFAKKGENKFYIKPSATSNGSIVFQFLNGGNMATITTIETSDFVEDDYTEITVKDIGV